MKGDATVKAANARTAEIYKRISRKEEKYLKSRAFGRDLLIESGRNLIDCLNDSECWNRAKERVGPQRL